MEFCLHTHDKSVIFLYYAGKKWSFRTLSRWNLFMKTRLLTSSRIWIPVCTGGMTPLRLVFESLQGLECGIDFPRAKE